jgi:hypothetical protein
MLAETGTAASAVVVQLRDAEHGRAVRNVAALVVAAGRVGDSLDAATRQAGASDCRHRGAGQRECSTEKRTPAHTDRRGRR